MDEKERATRRNARNAAGFSSSLYCNDDTRKCHFPLDVCVCKEGGMSGSSQYLVFVFEGIGGKGHFTQRI